MCRAPNMWERAKHGKLKGPLMKAPTADPERVIHALAGAGNKAIERHRDFEAQLGHVLPPSESPQMARQRLASDAARDGEDAVAGVS